MSIVIEKNKSITYNLKKNQYKINFKKYIKWKLSTFLIAWLQQKKKYSKRLLDHLMCAFQNFGDSKSKGS